MGAARWGGEKPANPFRWGFFASTSFPPAPFFFSRGGATPERGSPARGATPSPPPPPRAGPSARRGGHLADGGVGPQGVVEQMRVLFDLFLFGGARHRATLAHRYNSSIHRLSTSEHRAETPVLGVTAPP